jgi:hypothetical protein
MINTYLLEVIKSLSPTELKAAEEYLFFQKSMKKAVSEEVCQLFCVIVKSAPDFSEEHLKKEHIYEAVYGKQPFVAGKLEKLMAELNKSLRIHLLSEYYQDKTNEVQKQIDWAAWLRERGMADRSRQSIAKARSQVENEWPESLSKARYQLLIAEEEIKWESSYNQVKGDLNIPKAIFHLGHYYHVCRLEWINRYRIQQKGAQLVDLELMEAHFDDFCKQSVQLSLLNRIHIFLQSDEPSPEEARNIFTQLTENSHRLSEDAVDDFFAYLRNICTLLINAGALEFIPVLFEIQKDNLERGFLTVNGQIPHNAYLSVVQIAIRAQESAWAVQFTQNYRNKILGGDEADFFFRFNLAHCLFAQKDFNKALDTIPDAPSSIHYHHILRRLELKLYYELKSDLLLFKLDAFRKYIERTAVKTISNQLRTMDLNFLNILLQLAQSPPKDKARSARLVARIESKKLIADRGWLLEKARELG